MVHQEINCKKKKVYFILLKIIITFTQHTNTQAMLENKITLKEDSIEKLFCEPFSKLKVRQMTEEETGMMVSAIMAQNCGKGDSLIDDKDKSLPFSIRMLRGSLGSRFSFEMTDSLQLMMASLSQSAGMIIMYLTYLQFRAKKMNKRKLDINDLGSIFPMGFPTEEELHRIWDSQKVKRPENGSGSDNLLDYQTALKSIHFD